MQTGTLAYILRLTDKTVFDPIGDELGKVRDFVLHINSQNEMVCIGLVIDLTLKKRIFVPMTRVISISAGQIVINGFLNMRRFKPQKIDILAIGDMLDREVTLKENNHKASIQDIGLELQKDSDWIVKKIYVNILNHSTTRGRFLGKNANFNAKIIDASEVKSFRGNNRPQSARRLIEEWEDYKPADIAEILMSLPFRRQMEIAQNLTDEKLADILEELPEATQAKLILQFDPKRAAEIVESMQPDDAADLLNELPKAKSAELLDYMNPADAEDVKQLLSYPEDSAGGLMTTDCVILSPESPVSEALALIRAEELPPAVASVVFVTRPPLETPTGRFIGTAHFQELLRVPPTTLIGDIIDTDANFVYPDMSPDEVTRILAQYDQLSLPVLDSEHKLLGAISIDDVLDHILPDDWRKE